MAGTKRAPKPILVPPRFAIWLRRIFFGAAVLWGTFLTAALYRSDTFGFSWSAFLWPTEFGRGGIFMITISWMVPVILGLALYRWRSTKPLWLGLIGYVVAILLAELWFAPQDLSFYREAMAAPEESHLADRHWPNAFGTQLVYEPDFGFFCID